MRIITKLLYGLFIAILIGVAGLFLLSLVPLPLAGSTKNIEVKIVKSGSMEPAIPTGSLVVVWPETSYAVGDIITFGEDTKRDIPTTHRIVEVQEEAGQILYATKGDANEEADTGRVAQSDVIGKVVFSVPQAGFVLDFARQPLGFTLLIGIPAGLIILEELFAIARELLGLSRKRRKGGPSTGSGLSGSGSSSGAGSSSGGGTWDGVRRFEYVRRFSMDEIAVPVRIASMRRAYEYSGEPSVVMPLVACLFIISLNLLGAGATFSYFRDEERSTNNIFAAGTWEALIAALAPEEGALMLQGDEGATSTLDVRERPEREERVSRDEREGREEAPPEEPQEPEQPQESEEPPTPLAEEGEDVVTQEENVEAVEEAVAVEEAPVEVVVEEASVEPVAEESAPPAPEAPPVEEPPPALESPVENAVASSES